MSIFRFRLKHCVLVATVTASLYTIKTSRCQEHFAKRNFSIKGRVGARFLLRNRVPHRGILHEHLNKNNENRSSVEGFGVKIVGDIKATVATRMQSVP